MAATVFSQPSELVEGKHYLLKVHQTESGTPIFTQVTFLGYTAHPAVVVVMAGNQSRIRCDREELYYVPVDISEQ